MIKGKIYSIAEILSFIFMEIKSLNHIKIITINAPHPVNIINIQKSRKIKKILIAGM